MQQMILLQILLLAQHVSGTIIPIIRSSRVLYRWLLPVVFGALVFKLSVWCGAEDCVRFAGCCCSSPQTGHTFYFHIFTTMHGQYQIKFRCVSICCSGATLSTSAFLGIATLDGIGSQRNVLTKHLLINSGTYNRDSTNSSVRFI